MKLRLKIFLWSLLSILFLLLGYFFGPRLFKQDENENVKVAEVKRGDLQVKILATGTVQPENRLEIKSPVAGRVEKVFVTEGQKVKKGQVLAWMSSTERAVLIDSARALGAAELKRWQEMYKPTPITAPIEGMIILKNIEAGQTFTTNDAVLVMSNRLMIKAQVDETDLAQIKAQQPCEIQLDSYPEHKLSAKVAQIAYEAKTVSNVTTYLVEILPEEVPDFMRSGMTANVTFMVETKRSIVLVPTEFIVYETGKPSLKFRRDKSVQLQEVQLGVSDGRHTEILAGAQVGEKIIFNPPLEKKRGNNPFSPMGNRRGGK